jgi:hypothetical protein
LGEVRRASGSPDTFIKEFPTLSHIEIRGSHQINSSSPYIFLLKIFGQVRPNILPLSSVLNRPLINLSVSFRAVETAPALALVESSTSHVILIVVVVASLIVIVVLPADPQEVR